MPIIREIALSVLPHFAANVIARRIRTYGHYASAIGRDPATEGVVIGHAMHAIGAACILCRVPLAPLHFVERADGNWRGVFESNPTESIHVLPHYDVLYVAAREYGYSETDFQKVEKALREVIPKHFPSDFSSPHDLWLFSIHKKLNDGSTFFERALQHYKSIISDIKQTRNRKPNGG